MIDINKDRVTLEELMVSTLAMGRCRNQASYREGHHL
jgi:hypothetical protein